MGKNGRDINYNIPDKDIFEITYIEKFFHKTKEIKAINIIEAINEFYNDTKNYYYEIISVIKKR